ncbi:MAG: hypothetical protein K0R55_3308 [Sporomusa sp.]|nr:hypothetical protein [Sporomusa sp.]
MNKNPAIKTFMSALLVLVGMLVMTGMLTQVVPGANRSMKWYFAPVAVLASDSGPLVIAIILFLLIIGGALHVLKATGLIEGVIVATTKKYQDKEFVLLSVLVLVFMAMGAFVGVFEEIVPLVPLVILLAKGMGWDDMTGLGISILACGLGFAAAVTNPFTIGVAQELADLPLFSGAALRIFVFISVYLILLGFLWRHIKKTRIIVEKHTLTVENQVQVSKKAYVFFGSSMAFMGLFIAGSPFVPILRDLSLPVIALVFLIAAIGVGKQVKGDFKWVLKQYAIGAFDMAPAIVLILLATGIKHIMMEGHILDYILSVVSSSISQFSPFGSVVIIFVLVLILNFFIGSGSAKAFILMPILVPTMDLLGLGRQLGILAFQFGDGFSNVLYPTNAVLLIALGLSGVSYGKWLKFILPIQVVLFVLSIIWLAIAYQLGYGL